MDYSKLSEITVKSQKELDDIPKDFGGRIYIEFGMKYSPAIVRSRYKYPVEARGNSSVEAWENSSVVARENSSVEALENSSVEARGNSSVEARGNAQIVDCLAGANGRIKISGNARIVHNPKTIHEYTDFYGLTHTKKYGTFYKSVHKIDGKYVSDYNRNYEYIIGQKTKSELDTDPSKDCGEGIHLAYMQWALDFGRQWDDLAILEVKAKLDDVIVPPNSGKVRVGEVTVVREVPLEECGLFGKILARRIKK